MLLPLFVAFVAVLFPYMYWYATIRDCFFLFQYKTTPNALARLR
jgi:hypothetical protein